jgi:hypothetical protein
MTDPAPLLPALPDIFDGFCLEIDPARERADVMPLALLEVGASAGLCLLPDFYAYDYGGAILAPEAQRMTLPVFTCVINAATPVPTRPPRVFWRAGLDDQVAILRRGAAAWNAWRAERDMTPDLSGAGLRGLDLTGFDLSRADLRNADLRGTNLSQANLSGAHLERANLFKAVFVPTRWRNEPLS